MGFVGVCWCLLVFVGVCWCLLVFVGVCWHLLVSAGVCGVCLLLSVGVCQCLSAFVGICWCLMAAFVGICPHLLHIKIHCLINFCPMELNDTFIESSHQAASADSTAEAWVALFMTQCPLVQLFSERSKN